MSKLKLHEMIEGGGFESFTVHDGTGGVRESSGKCAVCKKASDHLRLAVAGHPDPDENLFMMVCRECCAGCDCDDISPEIIKAVGGKVKP